MLKRYDGISSGRRSCLDLLGGRFKKLDAILPPADLKTASSRFACIASSPVDVTVLFTSIRVSVWRVREWRFLLSISALASGFLIPAVVLLGIRNGAFVFAG